MTYNSYISMDKFLI